MTGKLSDRPMIRAASIPHLGQITPTAAFGLRAIRSLLARLDASWPLTVLWMSPALRVGAGLSRNESLSFAKAWLFRISPRSHAIGVPAKPPTFVDTTHRFATFPSPANISIGKMVPGRRIVPYTTVSVRRRKDVIVGICRPGRRCLGVASRGRRHCRAQFLHRLR